MDPHSKSKLFQTEYLFERDSLDSISSISNNNITESPNDSLKKIIHQSPHSSSKQTDIDLLRQLMIKFKSQERFAERLCLLEEYKIIIVCDDSGSMKTTVDGTKRTRWDELCSIVKIVLEIGLIFHSTGIDIHFLNRGSFINVTNLKIIDNIFSVPPCGYTPLVPVLRRIFKFLSNHHEKVLVFIATDGEPTDENGDANINELEYVMIEERQSDRIHVMFLLCSDDLSCVGYLTEWDQKMINVDLTDDYKTESEKVRSFRGKNYPFSIGDYILKVLIGAIDPEIDILNEPDQFLLLNND